MPTLRLSAAIACFCLQLVAAEPAQPQDKTPAQSIQGWSLKISPKLLADHSKEVAAALPLLENQLKEIVQKLPAPAVQKLQQIPLYFSTPYGGKQARAEYHPSAEWLAKNGRDPGMAKGVEFTNLAIFSQEVQRMPNFALHELAHGYHDRELQDGFKNREIITAYQTAVASKSYEQVQRWNGKEFAKSPQRAYAMTNPMEYFAESTEAFFSKNDFYPFNREELLRHDPAMCSLLIRLWGVQAPASR